MLEAPAAIPHFHDDHDLVPSFLNSTKRAIVGIPVIIWSAGVTSWKTAEPVGWMLVEAVLRIAGRGATTEEISQLLAVDSQTARRVARHCLSEGWLASASGGRWLTTESGLDAIAAVALTRKHQTLHLVQDSYTGELLGVCESVRYVPATPRGNFFHFVPGTETLMHALDIPKVTPAPPTVQQFARISSRRALCDIDPRRCEVRLFTGSARHAYLPLEVVLLTRDPTRPLLVRDCFNNEIHEMASHEQVALRRDEIAQHVRPSDVSPDVPRFLEGLPDALTQAPLVNAYTLQREALGDGVGLRGQLDVMNILKDLVRLVAGGLLGVGTESGDVKLIDNLESPVVGTDLIEAKRRRMPEFWEPGENLTGPMVAAALRGDTPLLLPWFVGLAISGACSRRLVRGLQRPDVIGAAVTFDRAGPGEIDQAELAARRLLLCLREVASDTQQYPGGGDSGEKEEEAADAPSCPAAGIEAATAIASAPTHSPGVGG